MNFTKNPVILQTDLPGIERHAQGKVRDVYSVDENRLLIVATDRISAFDYILATGIPDKGRVLTQLSIFWFDFLRDVTPTHFLTANVDEYPEQLQPFRDQLEGRSMLVKRANMIEIECVARGYISGSGWKEYREQRHGVRHPAARRVARERQTSRADLHARHQGAIGTRRERQLRARGVADRRGPGSKRLRDLTLEIYSRAARYAETKGVIIADTKFEFGFVDGRTGAGR